MTLHGTRFPMSVSVSIPLLIALLLSLAFPVTAAEQTNAASDNAPAETPAADAQPADSEPPETPPPVEAESPTGPQGEPATEASSDEAKPAAEGPTEAEPVPAEPPGDDAAETDAAKSDSAKSEPKLRFSFRFQLWEDVLDWLAEQADLSLVVDAPPPGTFNYTDTKEYTPTEAIDLLNGVLLTKGYTLIRRGRMLLVVDLSEGVPEGLVPQVSLEELAQRGKFELVTVQFPLGRRPVPTVESEIKPLLGPYGKVVALPATSQVLVTDTAGIMRAIDAIIQSISEPPLVPSPPVGPPPVPEMRVYSIAPADPKLLMEAVESLAPSAKVVLDEAADQLHVHAVPADHTMIEGVLEAMKEGNPPEKQPSLQTYPVAENLAEGLLQTLQTVLPEARLTLDASTGKVVAWCTQAEHETIKETIEKLGGEGSPATTRQLEVYRLTRVEPETALSMLQSILPDARLAVDAQSRVLVAVGVPADQEVIRRTLQQLQPERPGPDIPELRYYPLALTLDSSAITALKKTVPRATITLEANGDRLMVVATPNEHEKIKATIGQIENAAFAKLKSKLVVYPVTQAQRKRFLAVLSSLSSQLSGIRVVEDAEPGELSIWAKPQQHEVLTEILQEFTREVPQDQQYQLASYPVGAVGPESVMNVLEEMFPEVKIVLDQESKRLLVWARPADQEAVQASVEKLQPHRSGTNGLDERELRIYPFPYPATQPAPPRLLRDGYRSRSGSSSRYRPYSSSSSASSSSTPPAATGSPSLLTALQSLVPQAEFTLDAENKRLIVIATAADHAVIKKTLDQLAGEPPPEQTAGFELYPIRGADVDDLIATLQPLFPEMKLSDDDKTGNLVAWGTPREQQMLKTALGKLTRGVAGGTLEETPQLEVYGLSGADPDATLKLLEDMLPTAQLSVDTKTRSLVALAVAADQKVIKITLEQLASAGEKRQLAVYPVTPAQQKRFEAVQPTIEAELPDVKIITDAESGELAIWARPAEHETIRGILEQLKLDALGSTPQLEVYRLTKADPSTTLALLQSLLPNAELTLDAGSNRLIALAVAADQQAIKGLLEQLQPQGPSPDDPELRFYPLLQPPPSSVMTMLEQLVPEAKISVEADQKRLMAVATAADHEVIKSTLERVEKTLPPEEKSQLMVYPVTAAQRTRFEAVLGELAEEMPGMKVIAGGQPGELAIWAKPTQHVEIAQMIQRLQPEAPVDQQYQLVAYQLTSADPASVLSVLEDLFPDAKIVLDKKASRLAVWAAATDHQAIRQAIEQMDKGVPADVQEKVMVYPVSDVDPTVVLGILQEMLPEVKFQQDATAGTIVAWATPKDHEKIKQVVEQLQPESLGPQAPVLRIYPYPYPAEQAAPPVVTSSLPTSSWRESWRALRTGQLPPRPTPPSDLLTALKQLVPKAQFTLDAKGKRLIVVASPDDHEIVKQTLDQVQVSVAMEEKSQLVVYPVTTAQRKRFEAVLESVTEEMPDVRVITDAAPGELSVWAKPTQHVVIGQILEQLKADVPEGQKHQLVAHPIRSADPQSVLTVVEELFPDNKFVLDAKTKRLMVYAGPDEQQEIATALQQMDPAGAGDGQDQFVAYPVRDADPEVAIEMLQELLPNVTLRSDATAGTIVARASATEQQLIAGALEQMQSGPDGKRKPTLVVYPTGHGNPTAMQLLIAEMVPGAQVVADEEKRTLAALATPEDHELIKSAVEGMSQKEPPETAARAVVYTLESGDYRTSYYAYRLLRNAVPEATFAIGADPSQLIAWARPDDHQLIEALLQQMSQEGPAEKAPKLVVYALKHKTAAAVENVLDDIVPDAHLTVDEDNPQNLMVWAPQADHDVIKQSIAQLDTEEPADQAAKPVLYVLEGRNSLTSAYYALRLIRDAVPRASFTLGADPSQLIAWARPEDHKVIQELVDQLSGKGSPETTPTMEVYALRSKTAETIIEVLETAVPDAKLIAGDDPQELIAWARPADHEKIKATLAKLDTGDPAEGTMTMVVYPLESTTATAALPILEIEIPTARFSAGPAENQLVAWARAADHQKIQETVEKLDVDEPAATAPRVVVYTLKSGTATALQEFLATAVPEATVAVGEDPSQLIAWATPSDQEKIKSAVEQIDLEQPPEVKPTVEVYTLEGPDAATAMEMLSSAVPNAQLSVGTDEHKLIARARPSDHDVIKSVVESLSQKEPPETAPRMAIYTLDSAGRSTYYAYRLLREAVPNATFTFGSEPNQLIAWARPADHDAIKALLEQMAEKPPEDKAPKLVVYTLKAATADSVSDVLRTTVPQAEVIEDAADPKKFSVWATPADQETVQKIVEQLDLEEPPETAAKVVVYTVELSGSRSSSGYGGGSYAMYYLTRLLREVAPGATFTTGSDPSQLVAFARPKEHEKIKAVIDQMSAEEPPEKRRTVAVYKLEASSNGTSSSYYLIRLLREVAPGATFSTGVDSSQLVAFARPTEHEKIKAVIDQMSAEEPPDKRRTVVIYTLETGRYGLSSYTYRLLREVAPGATFTSGAEPGQLVVLAKASDHEKIKAIVEQMSDKLPPDKRPTVVVYQLKSKTAADVLAFLSEVAPNAELTVGDEPGQLLAWARPSDHEEIKTALEKLDVAEPPETAARLTVYTLKATTAVEAMEVLTNAVPNAQLTAGTDPSQLFVWARPDDHQKVQETLDQLDGTETAPRVEVYSLEATNAAAAMQLLLSAVPQAKLSVGTDPQQLIVWARPADHEIIKSAIEQMEADVLPDSQRTLAVYPIRKEDVPSLMSVLDPVVKQNVRLVPDPNRDSLVVWATPKHQEAVKNAVEEFVQKLPEPVEPTSHVYRFRKADPQAALSVLTALVPAAEIALDLGNRSLVVSALPDDHEKIKETIEKMDVEDPEWSPTLKIHRLTSAEPTNLMAALQTLFLDHPEVQLSLDARNNAVIAKASPEQHKTISELIKEVEAAAADTVLELHSLKNVDTYTVMTVLETLLQRQGVQAELSIDTGSNQLIAIAAPEVHDSIRKALEQMQTEERELAIYQLDYIELATAELAISNLFRDEGYSNMPDVDSDPDTQQLFVRATKGQLAEIRDLLIKMGEIGLTAVQSGSSDRLRIIPFHGDAKAAVGEIQRIWPQLRKNPIRVVTPAAVAPMLQEAAPPDQNPKETTPDDAGAEGEPGAAGAEGTEGAAKANEKEEVPDGEPLPPVLVVLGEGSITVASEDRAALDQFESLLRTMSSQTGYIGRDFSIYPIRNTSAAAVAATLMQLLRAERANQTAADPLGLRTPRSRLVIVPDARLNTLLVQGSRSDRAKIENLLTILDTDEVPETEASRQPKLIPIRNTRASEIEQVIREIFATQLTSARTGTSATAMPSWLSSQLSVDQMTNSLIVKAPSPLIDDITKLAQTLDEAAGESPSRGLKLIPLKKTNAGRIQEALEMILRSPTAVRRAPVP